MRKLTAPFLLLRSPIRALVVFWHPRCCSLHSLRSLRGTCGRPLGLAVACATVLRSVIAILRWIDAESEAETKGADAASIDKTKSRLGD